MVRSDFLKQHLFELRLPLVQSLLGDLFELTILVDHGRESDLQLELIPPPLVRAGREKELNEMKQFGVWEYVPAAASRGCRRSMAFPRKGGLEEKNEHSFT